MKVVNTVELKNGTNALLRYVQRGQPVAVTIRGKPSAALIPLTEDGLDDLVFEYSSTLRRLIAEAEADLRAGRTVTWETFLQHEAQARRKRSHGGAS
jgi:prevent-host-death family protein